MQDDLEHPAVAEIERLLDAMTGGQRQLQKTTTPLEVAVSLWLCACVSQRDAPTWLLYAEDEGSSAWCRVPIGTSTDELVEAQRYVGGHVDPVDVLGWLEGSLTAPWSLDVSGDLAIAQRFRPAL